MILSGCQIDSYGNKERAANVYLEQIPAVLVVERSQGFAYAPRALQKNFSFLKVDAAIDLNGPQLDFAGQHPHFIRLDIDSTNSWGPAGYFWALPQQLWPFMKRAVRAYEIQGHTAKPSTKPPTTGVWQSNQEVLAALNSTAGVRGWLCTKGGKPGEWRPLKTDGFQLVPIGADSNLSVVGTDRSVLAQ